MASENVRLAILNHRLAAAKDSPLEKAFYQHQLQELIHARATIHQRIGQIASTVLAAEPADRLSTIKSTHMPLTEHDCYRSVTSRIAEKCFDLEVKKSPSNRKGKKRILFQNEMVLNQLFVVANLCQIGSTPSQIHRAIDRVCTARLEFAY